MPSKSEHARTVYSIKEISTECKVIDVAIWITDLHRKDYRNWYFIGYHCKNSLETLQSTYKNSHYIHTVLLKVFNNITMKIDNKELAFLTLLVLSTAFVIVVYT